LAYYDFLTKQAGSSNSVLATPSERIVLFTIFSIVVNPQLALNNPEPPFLSNKDNVSRISNSPRP